MISLVFWTQDKKWAFQKVGNSYNIYNEDGDFVCECQSFRQMNEFIEQKQKQEEDYTGRVIGGWTVIRRRYDLKNTDLWLSKCKNGHRVNFSTNTLQHGAGVCQYCGNRWNEEGRIKTIDENGERNPMFTTWCGIKNRCNNENSTQYKNYGGRGIKMCQEWEDSFQEFYLYVSGLDHFGEEGRTLDRIDNEKGYFPGNVRWATAKEQANNKRPRKREKIHP